MEKTRITRKKLAKWIEECYNVAKETEEVSHEDH